MNILGKKVIIIGGGPAGLIAADTLSAAGMAVAVYEQKPTLARKFLMAGRGGLNITHSEPMTNFLSRYREAAPYLTPAIHAFPPEKLRDFCAALGEETFIGSSGRVFPKSFKASPLLRAWIKRMESQGVSFHLNHRWIGWNAHQDMIFEMPDGTTKTDKADACLLAVGGASWPKLGSDARWTSILQADNIQLHAFSPSNCGFKVAWSDLFRQKYAGTPVKSITLHIDDLESSGDMMITDYGIEGGAVYALSAPIRNSLKTNARTIVYCDLQPNISEAEIQQRLHHPRRKQSFSTYLKKSVGLPSVAIGLIQEYKIAHTIEETSETLAHLIKNFPVTVSDTAGIDRAISSAGGVCFSAVDENLMLRQKAGVFVAGEMLDWEAPTGGYLLQACFSTGLWAAQAIIRWL